MRVCHVFSNIHQAAYAGQPGIALRTVRAVSARGGEVILVSNAPSRQAGEKVPPGSLILRGKADLGTYLKSAGRIIGFGRAARPEIIHIHGYLLFLYLSSLSRFWGRPRLVCSLYETLEIVPPRYRFLLSRSLGMAERIFVSSDLIGNQLRELKIPPGKIEVLRVGLKEDFLSGGGEREKETDILYFGDSRRERGFDLVCRLARKLPEYRFLCLLRWQDRDCGDDLEELRKLPNTSTFFLPYRIPLKERILSCGLILLPYRWMGLRPPLSLVEAMALGGCVVTTGLSGNEELVRDGENGFILGDRDEREIEELLRSLLADGERRREAGREAALTIRKLYSASGYDRLLEVYRGDGTRRLQPERGGR